MKPEPPPPPVPTRLDGYYQFLNLFQTYLGQACLYLSAPEQIGWKVLFPPRNTLESWQFEQHYGKLELRNDYLRNTFDQVYRESKPRVGRFGGLTDLFAPVPVKGSCVGFLFTGPYLSRGLEAADLRRRWKEITGSEGSDRNQDFLRFVQAILRIPVLDPEAESACLRLMELMGRWIGGQDDSRFTVELDRMRREVFPPRLPHPYWVEWVVGLDKFFRRPPMGETVERWVTEEMGLTHAPSVVVALMPYVQEPRSGTVENLCRAKAFQRECFLAARKLPESVSSALGDYGALLLTSAKPGLTAAQGRLEVRDRIQEIRLVLERKFGVTVLAGVGSFQPGGGDLSRSYGEAVTGLHLAMESGKNPTFVEATAGESRVPPHAEVWARMWDLVGAFERGAAAKLIVARERFLRQVLFASLDQSDQVRGHLLSALQVLLERFERKSGVGKETARKLGEEMTGRLLEARTSPDLVGSFGASLESLARYHEKPKEAGIAGRVEETLRDLKADPARAWKLRDLCARAGVSAPTYLKSFRQVAGISFGPYLRGLRLEKAREMLQDGNLGLERVAQECGFSSAQSFIPIFRRAFGKSPRKYKPKSKADRP